MDDQSKFNDPEELVTCPLDNAHTMPRKRLLTHIQNCKKQQGEKLKGLKICPNNIQHIIPREEFEFHLQTCGHRDTHFLNAYSIGQEPKDGLPELMEKMTIPAEIEDPNGENWDEEATNVNILADIQNKSQDKLLLHSFSNLPPAQRKQLRQENRRKTRDKLNQDEKEFERKKTEFTKKPSKKSDDQATCSKKDDDEASVVSDVSLKSCTSSVASDMSYKTALTSSAQRLQSFQPVEEKKVNGRGRGRGRGRITPSEPILKLGIGRSKLRK